MTGVPENNLHYPVLVDLVDGGSGSGFFLNKDEETFLCTAKHVLWDDDKNQLNRQQCRITGYTYPDDSQYVLEVDLARLHQDGNLIFHQTADVAVAKILLGPVGQPGQLSLLPDVQQVTISTGGHIIGVGVNSHYTFADVGISVSVRPIPPYPMVRYLS